MPPLDGTVGYPEVHVHTGDYMMQAVRTSSTWPFADWDNPNPLRPGSEPAREGDRRTGVRLTATPAARNMGETTGYSNPLVVRFEQFLLSRLVEETEPDANLVEPESRDLSLAAPNLDATTLSASDVASHATSIVSGIISAATGAVNASSGGGGVNRRGTLATIGDEDSDGGDDDEEGGSEESYRQNYSPSPSASLRAMGCVLVAVDGEGEGADQEGEESDVSPNPPLGTLSPGIDASSPLYPPLPPDMPTIPSRSGLVEEEDLETSANAEILADPSNIVSGGLVESSSQPAVDVVAVAESVAVGGVDTAILGGAVDGAEEAFVCPPGYEPDVFYSLPDFMQQEIVSEHSETSQQVNRAPILLLTYR